MWLITSYIGIWYTNQKSNISNVYGDIIQTEKGFDDVIDIDIDNIILGDLNE